MEMRRRSRAARVMGGVRSIVSKEKKRFTEDGFNLDLSYITPRIIAMGWPTTGKESYYRNSATQVKAFIERYHAGHLKVYNLCKERAYPASLLGLPEAQLEQHGFYDHNAPPLALLRGKVAHHALHRTRRSSATVGTRDVHHIRTSKACRPSS